MQQKNTLSSIYMVVVAALNYYKRKKTINLKKETNINLKADIKRLKLNKHIDEGITVL